MGGDDCERAMAVVCMPGNVEPGHVDVDDELAPVDDGL